VQRCNVQKCSCQCSAERWGSPLVQEKYQEEKACDKRHPYRIIIIIIIIVIEKTTVVQYIYIYIVYVECKKTKFIPGETGVIEILSKSFRQYLSNTLGEHDIKELQNTAMLFTAHILPEVVV